MWRLCLLVFGVFQLSSSATAQRCNDVRGFDFKNATIHIAARDEGGRSGPDALRLRAGSEELADWSVKLVLDRLVHPDASTWIRVIILDKSHVTGTGDWHYIMAYGCTMGALVRLFQYGSEGVTLKHLDNQKMQLYQAVWQQHDAHCCPSDHTDLLYKWNALQHRYERSASSAGPGFESLADEK